MFNVCRETSHLPMEHSSRCSMARVAPGLRGSRIVTANCSVILQRMWWAMASLAVTMGTSTGLFAVISNLGTQDLLQLSRLVYRSLARKDELSGRRGTQARTGRRDGCGRRSACDCDRLDAVERRDRVGHGLRRPAEAAVRIER